MWLRGSGTFCGSLAVFTVPNVRGRESRRVWCCLTPGFRPARLRSDNAFPLNQKATE